MKKLLLTACLLIAVLAVNATELNYQWEKGKAYHFSAIVKDDVDMSMMGMTMNDIFTTHTDFVLYIESVDTGTAKGILYLINFKIMDSKGNILASLDDIPEKAIENDVMVDSKGNFTFLKKIYLITSGSTNVLAYGKADQNSVAVGGQAGNMKVDAYAEFDPKTGKLKAGYSVKEIENTIQVEVKVTEETDMVDVLPYSFLELLALPEGNINEGDEVAAQAGMYNMNVKVMSLADGIARLNHQMSTDKSQDMFDGGATGTSGDGKTQFDMGMDTDIEQGGDDFDMDMDMGDDMDDMDSDFSDMDDMNTGMAMDMSDMGMDMDGMGMNPEEQAAVQTSKGMAPDMTCDVNSSFDYQEGMFKKIGGTVTTKMNTMGMKMTVVSTLEMVLN